MVAEPAGEQSLEREIAEQKSGAVRDNPGERMEMRGWITVGPSSLPPSECLALVRQWMNVDD
jgi:hypothetical protein